MKKVLFFLGIACVTLAGCATTSPQQQAQYQEQLQATQPHCSSQRQCEAAWSAARDWVSAHCSMSVKTVSDTYIETYEPGDGSENLGCRVTKDPSLNGGYTVTLKTTCNAPILGCIPNANQSVLDFNKAVKTVADQFAGS